MGDISFMNYPPLNKEHQANDWIYVGEGNQNLVVRYVGSEKAFVSRYLSTLDETAN